MTGVAASLTNRAMPNLSTARRLVNIKCHSPSDGLTLTWSHVSSVTRGWFHRLPHSLAKNFTKSRFPRRMTGAGQYSVAGFQFTVAVLAGVFGGIWLDQKLGTSPWM